MKFMTISTKGGKMTWNQHDWGPKYLDAEVAHYKWSGDILTVTHRRPGKLWDSLGNSHDMKKYSWNVPWHVVTETFSNDEIIAIDKRIKEGKTAKYYHGRSCFTRPADMAGKVKKARLNWLQLLKEKQREGKLLITVSAKLSSIPIGILIVIVEEGKNSYVQELGGVYKRRWKITPKEAEAISWVVDSGL